MPEVAEGHEVAVDIDGYSHGLYVGREAIAAMRGEANRQADQWLREAVEAWEDCDVSDFEQVKEIEFKLGCARDAVKALTALAPIEQDDDS